MIIVTYKEDTPKMRKHTCCYCSSKFLYTDDERCEDNREYIECPVCHGRVVVGGDEYASIEEVKNAINKEWLKKAGSYQDR